MLASRFELELPLLPLLLDLSFFCFGGFEPLPLPPALAVLHPSEALYFFRAATSSFGPPYLRTKHRRYVHGLPYRSHSEAVALLDQIVELLKFRRVVLSVQPLELCTLRHGIWTARLVASHQ